MTDTQLAVEVDQAFWEYTELAAECDQLPSLKGFVEYLRIHYVK